MDNISVQREQLLRNGFVIMPGVVPAQELEPLRSSVEAVVEAQRADDPSWDMTTQPRASIASYVDEGSMKALEFVLHENTLAASACLLDDPADQVSVTEVSVLCNPEFEPMDPDRPGQEGGTDPRNWHRDCRPDRDGPLGALFADEQANGPAYVQWNIALYEDNILYVVPGSHRRFNNQAEVSSFQNDRGTLMPLPGSICVELKPGDGVAYNSLMLHWGSRYTNQCKRRTIHLGYRTFGRIFPRQRFCTLPIDICDLFAATTPPWQGFKRLVSLYRDEFSVIKKIFCDIIAGRAEGFYAGLARLHPAPEGRLTCLILLLKVAAIVRKLSQERYGRAIAEQTRQPTAYREGQVSTALQEELASHFTLEQTELLWERFRPIDGMLRADNSTHVPGFLGPRTDYIFEQVPVEVTIENVTATLLAQP